MNFVFFNSVLEALGKKLNFDSISNYYGNSFAKDAAKIIQAANPLLKNGHHGNGAQTLLGMPNKMTVIEMGSRESKIAQMEKKMGDVSWFEEYLK